MLKKGKSVDIIGDIIGKSKYCNVFSILKTLTFKNGMLVKNKVSTLCLRAEIFNEIPKNLIQQHNRLAYSAPHLHLQPIIIDTDKRIAYTVMERFPGDNLYNIIKRNKSVFAKRFNLDQLLAMTLSILHAMQTQIQDYALIHNDIKDPNIIIHANRDGTFTSNFIDFYSGKQRREKNLGLLA